MQLGVTVALATVWLAVLAGADVPGAAATPYVPFRFTFDQYSPPSPRHHGAHGRAEASWKDRDLDEDQPLFAPSIAPRASILADGAARWPVEVEASNARAEESPPENGLATRDTPTPGVSMSTGTRESARAPAQLDDPFVADDAFQDQGPGSVEIYKLDLFKEKSLLSPVPVMEPTIRHKSKAPKKTARVGWKTKPAKFKSTTPRSGDGVTYDFIGPSLSRSYHKQSNFFEDPRTDVPPNGEPFGVGGVPELQVGCEGLEASSHKSRRSADKADGDGSAGAVPSPWLRVTPVSLDLDYELSAEEGYEEIDELVKLKRLEATTKRTGRNRGDMEATFNSDDFFGPTKREKLPVRGDLGESVRRNGSGSDSQKSRKEGDEGGREDGAERREDLASDGHPSGRRLLWARDTDEGDVKRSAKRSALWGFGEDEGVATSDELQSENRVRHREDERRRQEHERRRQEEARQRESHRRMNESNSEADRIRQEYENALRQREREDEERRLRFRGEGARGVAPDERQVEEERRRQEQRRRQEEENRRNSGDRSSGPFDDVERLRRLRDEERRRQEEERRKMEERRRQESEEQRRIVDQQTGQPTPEEQRRRWQEEQLRRREEEERRRRYEEEARRRAQAETGREDRRREEEERRRAEEENRRSGSGSPERNLAPADRRNLDDRIREWLAKRRQEEEAQNRRREEEERRRNESPASLTHPDPRYGDASARRREEERRFREMEEQRKTREREDERKLREREEERKQREREEERKMRQRQEEERERMLREYVRRNRPVAVSGPDDRRRDEANRRRLEEQRRAYAAAIDGRPEQNVTAGRDLEAEYRRQEEQRRRKLDEERKLQEYIRRNQPVNAARGSNESALGRDWLDERRAIEAARRQHDRWGHAGSDAGRRHHGPSAPTSIDPRAAYEDARRMEEARRLEEDRRRMEEERRRNRDDERRSSRPTSTDPRGVYNDVRRMEEERRRTSNGQRYDDERRRAEARRAEEVRREEEARRVQSARYEEQRRRQEAARLEEERRRQELAEEQRRRSQVGGTSASYAPRREHEDRRRLEEHARRQETGGSVPGNLVLDENRRAAERERQRQEIERRRRLEAERLARNDERRRQQEDRTWEHRQREGHASEQRRRQEEARLNSLPVSARIIVRSGGSLRPTVASRAGFENEIDFPGINPHRRGVEAARFPAAATTRPPARSPGPCVWAVVQCCPSNRSRLVTCFESMGCPGVNWDPNPCRGTVAQAARSEVMKFYAEAERGQDY